MSCMDALFFNVPAVKQNLRLTVEIMAKGEKDQALTRAMIE